MGLGVSLFLIAAGAILIWAVNATVAGIDLITVGWILFVIGIVSGFLSLVFWSSWFGPGHYASGRRSTTVDEGPPFP